MTLEISNFSRKKTWCKTAGFKKPLGSETRLSAGNDCANLHLDLCVSDHDCRTDTVEDLLPMHKILFSWYRSYATLTDMLVCQLSSLSFRLTLLAFSSLGWGYELHFCFASWRFARLPSRGHWEKTGRLEVGERTHSLFCKIFFTLRVAPGTFFKFLFLHPKNKPQRDPS